MKRLWVVVAHRAGARILERKDPKAGLSLLVSIDHERGRLQNQELESDKAGSARVGVKGAVFEQHDDPHHHDAKVFAKSIAERLEQGRNDHAYDALVLVAEPHFLGMLKEALDAPTAHLVAATVPKDLYQVEERDLAAHLGDALAAHV